MAGSSALYYPNIHLPSEEWLKANLLMFEQIQRIKPEGYKDKSPYIAQYEDSELVRPAEIQSYGYYRGQEEFLYRVQTLVDTQPDSYSLLQYENYKKSGAQHDPVTVHGGKLGGPIANFLIKSGLSSPETDENGFFKMHPAIGEALMSSIAIACAQEDGLDIVTANGKIHSWLANQSKQEAFDTLLLDDYILRSGDINLEHERWADNSASVVLFSTADMSQLSLESLKSLQGEHEAIEKLRNQMATMSNELKIIGDPVKQEKAMRDLAATALKQWKRDSKSLSHSWRTFFNDDLGGSADKLFDACVEGAYGSLIGGSGAAAAAGSFLTSSTFIAAGAGFGIGLIFHAARSYKKAVTIKEESVYQFLTHCQDNGIVLVA